MKLKTRKKAFITSTIIALLILIILTPLVVNYRRLFQIGFYRDEMKNSIIYPEGKGIIRSKFNLDYDDYNHFDFSLQVLSRKTGDVEFLGFSSIEGELLINSNNYMNINSSWTEPISSILINSYIISYKDDIVSLDLNISAQFFEQDQIHNETVNVILSCFIKYDEADIGNIQLTFIWLGVLFFVSYFAIPYILFLIFRPTFRIDDSDIDETRRKKYYDALSKRSKLDGE